MLLSVQQQHQVMGLGPEICPLMAEIARKTGPLLPLVQPQCLRELHDPSSPPSQAVPPCLRLQAPIHPPGLTPREFSKHVCSFLHTLVAPRPTLQGATSGLPTLCTDCTAHPPPLVQSSRRKPLGQVIPPLCGNLGCCHLYLHLEGRFRSPD